MRYCKAAKLHCVLLAFGCAPEVRIRDLPDHCMPHISAPDLDSEVDDVLPTKVLTIDVSNWLRRVFEESTEGFPVQGG